MYAYGIPRGAVLMKGILVNGNYFLLTQGTSAGPTLSYNGAPVTAGEFGGWMPIDAEPTDSGYEVVWKLAGADSYTIWNTDNNGNYLSSIASAVSGTNPALQSAESTFQLDLNGDGAVAAVGTVIESVGATDLVQSGNNYFLYAHGTSSGPVLSYNGSPVTVGEFSGWTPIGAEPMNGGYRIAWKLAGADSYTIWNTDSTGNYVSTLASTVSGTSLQTIETSFQQDLNGDGVIGPPRTGIEAVGLVDLVQLGRNYLLQANGTFSSPLLRFGGAAVTVGQFGGWTPIGAEPTLIGAGYEIAWKLAGSDAYTIWLTDQNGNYSSNLLAAVPGNSIALEAAESGFQQDLNGDGRIGTGLPVTPIDAVGPTHLVQVGNNYLLVAGGTSTGPVLSFNGAPVTPGEFGGWAPIGAEHYGSGYNVVWKLAGSDSYTIWNTDSGGSYTSMAAAAVPGTNPTLEVAELGLQQDLNGDGVLGLTNNVVEAFGSTDLVQFGFSYFLHAHGTQVGPLLSFNSSPVMPSQFGGWTLIGAEAMNGGYEVAWKLAGADSYTIWNTDGSGNYQSSLVAAVAGTNTTLEAAESSFHQDLNGDGVIGVPRTMIEAAGATDLVQVGGNYFLDAHGTSTGPQLSYNSAPVTAGEFGGWMPVGAEAMNGGYEVAWKLAGADSYTIWSADAAGHYQTNLLAAVPGTNTALESAETSFQQDLNGNGMIGTPASAGGTVTTSGADMLTVVTNPTPILIALGIRNGETAHISSPFDSAVVFYGFIRHPSARSFVGF